MMMVTTTIYKPDTIDRFGTIDSISFHLKPRVVNNNFSIEKKTVLPFLTINNLGVIVNTKKSAELITQAMSLRKKHLWCRWKMYAPSRKSIKSTISVINYCPSDLFLEGFQVVNYGNGTVAMLRRSDNYSTTINIGNQSLTFAKLRISDHEIVNSGCCRIERNAIEQLFETL